MRKVLEKCPACGGGMEITRMNCRECETLVESRFETCLFCRLSPESLHFVEIFVKNRGNLKEMERELRQPYQTLRGQLNAVIGELGFEVEPVEEGGEGDAAEHRREVLARLDRGEIGADEAVELLEKLN